MEEEVERRTRQQLLFREGWLGSCRPVAMQTNPGHQRLPLEFIIDSATLQGDGVMGSDHQPPFRVQQKKEYPCGKGWLTLKGAAQRERHGGEVTLELESDG